MRKWSFLCILLICSVFCGASKNSPPPRQERIVIISRFSTCFDAENANRAHNIRLACRNLSGCVIAPGAVLSFNQAVGRRTRENGFLESTVIYDGEFTRGVGGGVCQVSTTLYNCALLAGVTVLCRSAHSLAVGYIEPSFDATVSEWKDLKIANPYPSPIYLKCEVQQSCVICTLFGHPIAKTYERRYEILEKIPPPEPLLLVGTEAKTVQGEREGLVSRGYLDVYTNGKLTETKLLGTDTYAPMRKIEWTAEASDADNRSSFVKTTAFYPLHCYTNKTSTL